MPRRRTPRVFISYSTADKLEAGRLARAVEALGLETYLAHDKLKVSETWKKRILDELVRADAFLPLLSNRFCKSSWAPQEAGFIASRPNVPILPLTLDRTVSFGFFDHIQAGRMPDRGEEPEALLPALGAKFPRHVLPAQIKRVIESRNFRTAEARLLPLAPFYGRMTRSDAEALASGAVENGQVWNAHLCRTEYLPRFLRSCRSKLSAAVWRALDYQVREGEWYRGES